MAGDDFDPPPEPSSPPRHPPTQTERLDFSAAFDRFGSHADLVTYIIATADDYGEPFAVVLTLLEDLEDAPPSDVRSYRAQNIGASYKQVALICHLAGMSAEDRQRFYRIAENLCLSQRCAAHLIGRLS